MIKQSFDRHFQEHIAGSSKQRMPFRRVGVQQEKVNRTEREMPIFEISKSQEIPKKTEEIKIKTHPSREQQIFKNRIDDRVQLRRSNVDSDVNQIEIKKSEIFKPRLSVQQQLEKRRLEREIVMSLYEPRDVNNDKTEAGKSEIGSDGKESFELEDRFSEKYAQTQDYFCCGDKIPERNEAGYKRKSSRKSFIKKSKDLINLFRISNLFVPSVTPRLVVYSFVICSMFVAGSIGIFAYVKKGLNMQSMVLGVSQEGIESFQNAALAFSDSDTESSIREFSRAEKKFSKASDDIDELGVLLVDASKYVPVFSKISSGKYSMQAAEDLSAAGKEIAQVIDIVSVIKNPISNKGNESISILGVFLDSKPHVIKVREKLISARNALENVNINDFPEDKRDEFVLLRRELPSIISICDVFIANADIFADLFGANGPRKYLFLFQNNNEMRPTGGFIGSYGLLDISNGKIRNFFIDGIFNPDGQLKEKIVPPSPIQKMSAAWSLHDSNWWPDFPTSAKEAVRFYEKTGGPTADGVITLTPVVMQKFLEITGPIEMSEYGVTLDANNFIEKTQYEVEVDYDKEENKPKKILSDLAPIVLDKLLGSHDPQTVSRVILALSDALTQKHILLYSDNKELQELISKQGWSGEVLSSEKDYLSVINTNVNGFKTDGVVDENITHEAEIRNDGSVVDTVTITRIHKGGDSEFEWWNKVNCDYMRVYVPKGSTLLEVSGQTREFTDPPLDYDALNFKRNAMVMEEESSMLVDEKTGTRIYEQFGKTVFANWVYVSPKENVTITYKYVLPFKLFQVSSSNGSMHDTYSLVAQKQSGSIGSSLISSVSFPETYDFKWKTPNNAKQENRKISNETTLDTDHFFGFVFEKK